MQCRVIVICLLNCFFHALCHAQADSILNFKKNHRFVALSNYFITHNHSKPSALPKLRQLEQDFLERGEEELAFEVWLETVQYDLYYDSLSNDEKIGLIRERLVEAQDDNEKINEAECLIQMGIFAFNSRQYGPGFEWMMKGLDILYKKGWRTQYRKMQDLGGIGHAFYKFGDYETALKFLLEAEKVRMPPTHNFPKHVTNTIALAYQKLYMYDSAIHYYQKSMDLARIVIDTFWVALTQGNLGAVYFKAGQYDKALPLLEKDYNQSIRSKELGSAANAAQLLATIALQRGDLAKAEEYIRFTRSVLDTSNVEVMVIFYNNMYDYSRKKNDLITALAYSDSLKTFQARLEKIIDTKLIDQARMKVQIDKHQAEVKLLETARSRQVLIRNGLLIILTLAGLLAITWIRRLQYTHRKEKEMTQLKLKHAQEELNLYTKALLEKNELINNFRQELEQMQVAENVSMDQRTAAISRLTSSTLLTDEDWKVFRKLFDDVYPGFFIRLKEKMFDLTPAEVRLMALTKLRISPKDMADMLGISADSIKKTRHRLRKKINLPEDGSLEEVVEMI